MPTHRLKNSATPSRPSLTQYCSTRPLWTFCRHMTASPFIAALNAATSMASVLRGCSRDGSCEMAAKSLSHLSTGILAKFAAFGVRSGTSSSESSPAAAAPDAAATPVGLSTSIALPLPLTSAAGAAGRFGAGVSTICLVAASLLTCCRVSAARVWPTDRRRVALVHVVGGDELALLGLLLDDLLATLLGPLVELIAMLLHALGDRLDPIIAVDPRRPHLLDDLHQEIEHHRVVGRPLAARRPIARPRRLLRRRAQLADRPLDERLTLAPRRGHELIDPRAQHAVHLDLRLERRDLHLARLALLVDVPLAPAHE